MIFIEFNFHQGLIYILKQLTISIIMNLKRFIVNLNCPYFTIVISKIKDKLFLP